MSSARWERIKELHARALELPNDERRAFLRAQCGADEELFAEVEALLETGDVSGSFLEPPVVTSGKESDDEAKPRVLGDFVLEHEIGRGAMGIVYRAHQISLGRDVAVKVLPPSLGLQQRHIDRFHREAQAVAKLQHPAIVAIHTVGVEKETHYFAMDLIEGRNLHDEVLLLRGEGKSDAKPVLPEFSSSDYIATVTRLCLSAALALQYAHENGVVHRDVKPSNLLLDTTGQVRVVDFGLAKVEALGSLTRTGERPGTPFYMSPEQALGERVQVDHRTDVFSLGVVMYELLTLRRPFQGKTEQEVLRQVTTREPRALRKVNPRVPRDLETLCEKALAKTPDTRFASAGELADELGRFLRHEAILTRRPAPWVRLGRHVRRRRTVYVPAAAASLLLVGSLFVIAHLAERNEVHARARPLYSLDERDDVVALESAERVELLARARELRRTGAARGDDAVRVERAIELIEEYALDRKRVGIEHLRRGMAPPPGTPPEDYPTVSDPDFFLGLQMLQEALVLLPDDAEIARWADPRSSFPQLDFLAEGRARGARVYAQAIDWLSHGLGERRLLGELPFDAPIPIEPGPYRITVVREVAGEVRTGELTRALWARGRLYELEPFLRPTTTAHEGMVRIPAGRYTVGDPTVEIYRQYREREIDVPAFWVDEREVTNAAYRLFVEQTGRDVPKLWEQVYRAEWDELPVSVTFDDARAYAEWVGKRLPTYHEWEIAARGPEAFRFPWGDDDMNLAERAVLGRPRLEDRVESYVTGVRPVGTTPDDRSAFGLLDTLGNVAEWTETINTALTADAEPYLDLGTRIVKGQGWRDPVSSWSDLIERTAAPALGSHTFGFRCAKSVWEP